MPPNISAADLLRSPGSGSPSSPVQAKPQRKSGIMTLPMPPGTILLYRNVNCHYRNFD